MNLSIVVPLLNEEESLGELVSWIDRVVDKMAIRYEIIFIDDGSTDKSWLCLLYTSPSPRDRQKSRMPSSA